MKPTPTISVTVTLPVYFKVPVEIVLDLSTSPTLSGLSPIQDPANPHIHYYPSINSIHCLPTLQADLDAIFSQHLNSLLPAILSELSTVEFSFPTNPIPPT